MGWSVCWSVYLITSPRSSSTRPPTWEQIRRSITRITKHTLSISSKLNDLNDLVKAIKISEYSTADGQQPALSAILSTPEKQPANVAAPSKSSATTSRRKGGFGLMDGEEESPDILQLIAPSMKSPKKDQQESRSNLIAQLKENLSKPDRKALINRTAINPPPIIASLIKKPLPVKEKKVLLPVASSMAPRATLLGQDARVAAPPATTRAATPSPVPASPPIVAAEPPKFAAPTIGPPATNFGLGAKPALTFASSSTTTISSGNGVLGAGATFGLSSAPPSSLFGTTSGKVTTAPLFDTSNATPDATKFGPPPIPFTATAPPPLLPKEEQPVAAKPNLFVFNNKPGTEVPSFGAPTTLAKDDKTETPTQSSFTNSSAPALILKNSDSSKPLKFGDATTAAATTTTPPDRGFFGATATLPSSNAASSSNAGPFGPIIPKPTPLFSEGAAKTTLPTSSTSALPAAVVPSSVAANTSLSFGSAPKQNGSTGLGSLATAPVAFAEFGLKVADSKSASTVKPSVSPTSAPSSPVKAPSSPQKIVHPKQSTAQSNLGDETLDNESVVAADQENTLKIGDLGAPSTAEVEEDEETEIPVSVNEEEQVLEDEYDEGGEAGEGEEEEFENRDDAYNRDDDDLDEAGDKPDSSFERDQDSPTSPSPPRPVAAATVAGSPVASSPIVVKSSIPAVPSTPPATTTSSSIFSTTAASKSPLKTASFLDPKPVSSSTEFRFGSSSMSSSTVASSTTSFGFGGSLSMTAAGASGGGTPVYGTTATFGSSIKPVAFDASAAAAFGKTFSGNNDVMKNGMRSDDESDNESKMSNDDDDDNHQQSSQRSQETSLGGLFGGSNMLGKIIGVGIV